MVTWIVEVIEIPVDIREAMVRHALDGVPNEACGLLAGRDGRVEHFYPIRNEDESPFTYRLDGLEHHRAEKDMELRGWQVVGIFHSHTHTEAYPSETDRRRAFLPDPENGQLVYPEAHYVIVSLADKDGPVTRAFRIIDAATVEEQEVMIV